jgi:hypothetical protein
MDLTVELDDEAQLMAAEVDDEGANRDLPAELGSQPPVAKVLP